ncbi:hypothetical protein ABE424_13155 [Stenotrophomonas sp. TWI1149]|uniref:hypothetical protein n=1 Tax=unclassified Stenotrophomonas TaxID=196198 RepID=UPI00320B8142
MADLFEALADHVHHGGNAADGGERALQHPGATLLSVFGPKLADHIRNGRHLVVLEAANITLRSRADDWLSAVDGGMCRHARALTSNSGLADVLAELEEIRCR